MTSRVACDVEGALRVWLNAQTALLAYLPNGVQLSEPRSPSQGAIASLVATADAGSDDRYDRRVVEVRVMTMGQRGGRAQGEKAARAVALTLSRLLQQLVTLPSGEQVLLVYAADVGGPLYSGQLLTGQAQHTVTATILSQPYPVTSMLV